MFTRPELERIAEVVQRHPDCVVVTDEVYEHITFDGRTHERIATVPGMCVVARCWGGGGGGRGRRVRQRPLGRQAARRVGGGRLQ